MVQLIVLGGEWVGMEKIEKNDVKNRRGEAKPATADSSNTSNYHLLSHMGNGSSSKGAAAIFDEAEDMVGSSK